MDVPKLIVSKSDLELHRNEIQNEYWLYDPNPLVHDDAYEVLKTLNEALSYTGIKYKNEEFIILTPELSSEGLDLQDKLDELEIYYVPFIN